MEHYFTHILTFYFTKVIWIIKADILLAFIMLSMYIKPLLEILFDADTKMGYFVFDPYTVYNKNVFKNLKVNLPLCH